MLFQIRGSDFCHGSCLYYFLASFFLNHSVQFSVFITQIEFFAREGEILSRQVLESYLFLPTHSMF
jgi:hypothetical protein